MGNFSITSSLIEKSNHNRTESKEKKVSARRQKEDSQVLAPPKH